MVNPGQERSFGTHRRDLHVPLILDVRIAAPFSRVALRPVVEQNLEPTLVSVGFRVPCSVRGDSTLGRLGPAQEPTTVAHKALFRTLQKEPLKLSTCAGMNSSMPTSGARRYASEDLRLHLSDVVRLLPFAVRRCLEATRRSAVIHGMSLAPECGATSIFRLTKTDLVSKLTFVVRL